MSARHPERALRRLVSDLAGRGAADIAEVLDALDERQRTTVEMLLVDFTGRSGATGLVPTDRFGPRGAPLIFSPILQQRLDGDGASSGFTLTPTAHAALRHAAQRVAREAEQQREREAVLNPSLLTRALARFARRTKPA